MRSVPPTSRVTITVTQLGQETAPPMMCVSVKMGVTVMRPKRSRNQRMMLLYNGRAAEGVGRAVCGDVGGRLVGGGGVPGGEAGLEVAEDGSEVRRAFPVLDVVRCRHAGVVLFFDAPASGVLGGGGDGVVAGEGGAEMRLQGGGGDSGLG